MAQIQLFSTATPARGCMLWRNVRMRHMHVYTVATLLLLLSWGNFVPSLLFCADALVRAC